MSGVSSSHENHHGKLLVIAPTSVQCPVGRLGAHERLHDVNEHEAHPDRGSHAENRAPP